MGKYDGTKTEQNLKTAFAGESMARNKYDYFSSQAKKEGLRANLGDFRGDGPERKRARQTMV